MDLKSAIKLAVRFAERPKAKAKDQPTIRQYVLFIPVQGLSPACLCAQNERCGILVSLDGEVPNTLIKASFLTNVAKDAKYEIVMMPAAYGGIEIKSGAATWQVPATDIPQLGWFPEIPAIPTGFRAIEGGAIERVLHAASKDEDRPALRAVNFREGYVEATDKARFARSVLPGGWRGLLPSEMFQRLPGDVEAAFTVRLAYLKGVGEVRFGQYVPAEFPDCSQLIPDIHTGYEGTVSVEALTRAARQALAVSETGSVTLALKPDRVTVSTWQADTSEPQCFQATLSATLSGEGQVLLSGKNLVAALVVIKKPAVRIRYNRPVDPLRLECAGYVEALWPMLA
jgi:hypothetical protein